MNPSRLPEGKPTKKKKTVVIEGVSDNPFESLQKLLTGFCDPRSVQSDEHFEEDNTTIATTWSSQPEQITKKVVVEGPGLTYGLNEAAAPRETAVRTCGESFKTADEGKLTNSNDVNGSVIQEMNEDESKVNGEKASLLKASHKGSNLRFRRGIEVTIVAVLAVVGTLLVLHRLGYKIDLQVVESQLRSEQQRWTNVINENSDAVVPGASKWIDIRFKEEIKPFALNHNTEPMNPAEGDSEIPETGNTDSNIGNGLEGQETAVSEAGEANLESDEIMARDAGFDSDISSKTFEVVSDDTNPSNLHSVEAKFVLDPSDYYDNLEAEQEAEKNIDNAFEKQLIDEILAEYAQGKSEL